MAQPFMQQEQGNLFQATVQKSKYGIVDNTETVKLLVIYLHNIGDSSCLNCLQVDSLMLLWRNEDCLYVEITLQEYLFSVSPVGLNKLNNSANL